MTSTVLSGLFDIGFAVFHMALGRLLRWPASLRASGDLNAATTRALNIMTAYCFLLYGGALVWLAARDQAISPLLLVAGGGFWLVRAAIQPMLFDMRARSSLVFTILFAAGVVLHVVAAMQM